jgi:glycosyltransferase involved in cell wall biosynthesis
MKTSLIFTTYNEEKTILNLMKSIKNQVEFPDEIIVVDSFSKDRTVEIIKSFKIKNLKIIQKKCNISKGRNEAIQSASYDYILATDGGCILEKDWVMEMKKAFQEGQVDYVMGNFRPLEPKTFIGKGISEVSLQSSKRLSRDPYFASTRSIGFKKKVWEKIGGFDEFLYTGEDTKFNIQVKNKGFRASFAKNAMVLWSPRENLKAFWNQFKLYGQGDRKAKNLFQVPDRLFLVIVYTLFHIFLIGGFFSFNLLIANLIIFGIILGVDTFRYSGFNPLKLIILSPFVYLKRLSYTIGVLF